ncbi:hypothetical protein ACFFVU_001611 [Salmonella enterica]
MAEVDILPLSPYISFASSLIRRNRNTDAGAAAQHDIIRLPAAIVCATVLDNPGQSGPAKTLLAIRPVLNKKWPFKVA